MDLASFNPSQVISMDAMVDLSKPTRRQMIKGTGSVAIGASLSGCALFGGEEAVEGEETNQTEGIPSEPLNIAFFTFTSGGASVFGGPSVNAAKLMVDDINSNGGILGEREINAEYIDEAAGTDQMVNRVREISTADETDVIIGFVSSGDALAVAPVAEENEQLTLIYDAGTYQLFEEQEYEYVFRPSAHLSVGGVGAARYIKEHMPDVETVGGINQDYSWGHDNWEVFKGAVEQLMPDVEIVTERFPELMSDDFTSHITALESAEPDVVFSSFWGGDTINFATQADAAGLFENVEMIYGGGEHMLQNVGEDMPEGIITGARGPHWPLANQEWPEHQFIEAYYDEYGDYPIYPSMHMYQAMRFYVQAVEKAYQITGNYPSQNQIATALEGSAIQTPNGFVSMPYHQAKEPAMFGRTVHTDEYDFALLEDRKYIAADLVNPPMGLDTMEWIETLE